MTSTKRPRKPLPAIDSRAFLTMEEAAAQLGVSKPTISRLIAGTIEGRRPLPAVLVSKRKKIILKASLESWIVASELNRIDVAERSAPHDTFTGNRIMPS